MQADQKRYWLAVTTLIGTIIGVGIFGVPYAISQVGLLVAILYFVALTAIQTLQHLFFAEAAIACPEPYRLVGLAEKYLGRRTRVVAGMSLVFAYWGGILAYVIVGGTFLHALLAPIVGGSLFAYQISWIIGAAAFVYFGLNVVSKINAVATLGLLGAMATIFVLGSPHVSLDNLATLFKGGDLFLPYGVILFSLSGLPAILEMEDILRGRHKSYRRAIIVGTLVAAALTAGFGFLVWGVTGAATTPDAITGFQSVLGGGIAKVVAVFGFLAVATSYFATALNLQSTFENDYHFARLPAWLLTSGVPLAVFLLGAKNFIAIIGFTGAVFGGITAVIVALLYVAVKKKHAVRERELGVPVWMAYLSMAMLAAGVVIEMVGTVAGWIRA